MSDYQLYIYSILYMDIYSLRFTNARTYIYKGNI